MGVVAGIDIDKYPRQGSYLSRAVRVSFNYDTSRTVLGRIIRDDAEEPGRLIIMLADERVVLGTECQYSLLPKEDRQMT